MRCEESRADSSAAARSMWSASATLALVGGPTDVISMEQNQRSPILLMADTERLGFDETTSRRTASRMAPASIRQANRRPCRDDLSSDRARAASQSWCSSSLPTCGRRSSNPIRSALFNSAMVWELSMD